jgi:pimeloyl-ACP methyl ester carboxylesterase
VIFAHTLDGHGPERALLMHDWLGDSTTYDPAMPYLDPAVFTCARVDFPGYGRSRALPVRGVGADVLDAGILAVADHLGWSRFHLISHSMSTVVAQRLARSSPARLASVTLTAPVTPGTHHPDSIVDFLHEVGRDPSRRRDALAAQSSGRLSPRWLEWKLERWAACSDAEAVATYVDLFARADLPATRAEVPVAVLAITGGEDAPPFRRGAVESALRAVHPDVAVEECSAAGHYPMQETPPLFATLVDRLVRANALVAR